eukprot:CAMPEP_0172728912 /NCGR_PEP_ID=MMETSP1074-20121228/93149_1 /TAXON_ID=2916 /ORGANISM="Ceratium fusus, Strain PA161109" /LENGTH=99 /DNA_ID=CAMNT_0013556239 /DNA_START=33 /DNA_END=332 /DNA_ORIENTATION=-
MQGKSWREVIHREQREHLNHSLNRHPFSQRSPSLPVGNPKDFYASTWRAMDRRYEQAAGVPSPLVGMARRLASDGSGARPLTSRPSTEASRQVTPMWQQ